MGREEGMRGVKGHGGKRRAVQRGRENERKGIGNRR